MRYSIVIPTRNRLALLLDAVYTIRRQNYPDWELIIYDNYSDDAIKPHLEQFKDDRIKCYRSDFFLPVTDSWNNAIDKAAGEFVILFGDDDGLLPGYFNRMDELIQRFDHPDVIYSALLQFFHPTVAPWERSGYVDEIRNAFFFADAPNPFILPRTEADKAVSGSLSLRRNFTFNMQAFTFKASFLNSCRVNGKVFQPPFPDYYLANYALARSEKTVVDPTPAVVAGVSRASFGYTLFNNLEERGAALLKSNHENDPTYAKIKNRLLPGPEYNTSYIITMEHLEEALNRPELGAVDYDRYRKLQIIACLEAQHGRLIWMRSPIGRRLWPRLSWTERLWATHASYALKTPGLFWQKRLKNVRESISAYGFQPTPTRRFTGDFAGLPELYDALAPPAAPDTPKSGPQKVVRSASPAKRRAATPGKIKDGVGLEKSVVVETSDEKSRG